MGKISQVSSKYIINASIEIEGFVDRPDVIGAIFGQTEGLLGAELELRELQRSGRIGRIEVNVDTKSGKGIGSIIIPSSLDKAETSIIAAALEVIQRIGPCNAKIHVMKIEDVRISKRQYIIDRAKELLREMIDVVMPDSQEIAEEVTNSVRVNEVVEYGPERLPAGPAIMESESIIIVEGRADVITLLKNGFKNAVAINGTSCPASIKELCEKKEVTVFVDGDRGGDLIIRELINVAEIDFITKAPDGKEVEELTKKEIHKALRSRVAAEQVRIEYNESKNSLRKKMVISQDSRNEPQQSQREMPNRESFSRENSRPMPREVPRPVIPATPRPAQDRQVNTDQRQKLVTILESMVGTRGACILDDKLNVLGKVPILELTKTVRSMNSGAYAVVLDGQINQEIVMAAESSHVQHLVGMDSLIDQKDCRVHIMVAEKV